MSKLRLDKYLSSQTELSRNDARTAIRRGRVQKNGEVLRDPSVAVDSETDTVALDGSLLSFREHLYVLLHKPAGVLSASTDRSRQTVVDLLPACYRRPGMFPVGRLDRDTTGLLILTDDGPFAHECLSPKYEIPKTYLATLDGPLTAEAAARLAAGVMLADGTRCRPAVAEPLDGNRARITITEGKYHQVKRMLGRVDLGVNALHRVSMGGLILPDTLAPGQCLLLEEKEAKKRIFGNFVDF